MMRKEFSSPSLALLPVRDYEIKKEIVPNAKEKRKQRKLKFIQTDEVEAHMRARKLGERFLQVMSNFTSILHIRLDADFGSPPLRGLKIAPQVTKRPKTSKMLAMRIPHPLALPDRFAITMLLPAPKLPGASQNQSVSIYRKRRKRKLPAKAVPKASQITWALHTAAAYVEDKIELTQESGHRNGSPASRVPSVQRLKRYSMQTKASSEENKRHISEDVGATLASSNQSIDSGTWMKDVAENEVKDSYEHNELIPLKEEKKTSDQSDIDLEGRETWQCGAPWNGESSSGSSADEEHVSELVLHQKRQKHTPAWISPDLGAWLINSGIYPTKMRSELVRNDPSSALKFASYCRK